MRVRARRQGLVVGQAKNSRRSATLAQAFSPYKTRATPHPVYDRVDPYYFPIGGFAGVVRPGPLVRLYRLD